MVPLFDGEQGARDEFPAFPPDGKLIAFSSNRQGNRTTSMSTAPSTLAVSPSNSHSITLPDDPLNRVGRPMGRKILFSLLAQEGVFPGVTTLFEISVDGGMEQPIRTDWGSWGSFSPDGTKLTFSRHPGVWSRKHYRGSYAVDLWLSRMLGGNQFIET